MDISKPMHIKDKYNTAAVMTNSLEQQTQDQI